MVNEDLVLIQRFWAAIDKGNRLEEKRRHLAQQAAAARQESLRMDAERVSRKSILEGLRADEQRVMQKLATFQRKHDDTRRLMDQGKASDYQLAQRQIVSAREVIDQLETEGLGLMDAIDTAMSEIQALEIRIVRFRQAEESAEKARAAELIVIASDLADSLVDRAEADAAIPAGYREQINRLFRAGRSLVSPLENGACKACNVHVSPQVLIEINRGSRLHACRTCGRFLVPEG